MTVLAPFGFRFSRNWRASSPTYQTGLYKIQNGYSTAIGYGDPVMTLSGGSAGYIGIYVNGTNHILGFFAGIALPFFDSNASQVVAGKQNWAGTEASGGDVWALVVDDPDAVMLAQVSGGPVVNTDRGLNIDIVVGTPSNAISTAALDYTHKGATSTYPLRIIGIAQTAMFGIDPTSPATYSSPAANNLVEVIMNTSERTLTTGI